MNRIFPKITREQVLAFVFFGAPTTLAANFVASGRYVAALVTGVVAVSVYSAVFIRQLVRNRATWYQWYVFAQTPRLALGVALLVFSSLQAHLYFDRQRTLNVFGHRLVGSSEMLLIVAGLLFAALIFRRVYGDLRPFSGRRSSESIGLRMDPAAEGDSFGVEIPAGSQSFVVQAAIPASDLLVEPELIVLERLSRDEKASGVIWTSTKIGTIARLQVYSIEGDLAVLITQQRGTERLLLREESQLLLVGVFPEGIDQQNAANAQDGFYRCVIYLKDGGLIKADEERRRAT